MSYRIPRLTAALTAAWAALLLLAAPARADVTLTVNGGATATVAAGDRLTFAWTASSDVTRLERGWGAAQGTEVALYAGSETIRAANPAVATTYTYAVSGYGSSTTGMYASVQVTVLPGTPAATTPITWVPSLPNYVISPLVFYTLPDAQVGVPYAATVTATGREPITFSAVSLPAGLSFSGNRITGTPTDAAFMQGGNFTLLATDADGITSATLARMMTPVLYPRTVIPVQAPVVFDGGAPDLNGGYRNDAGVSPERAISGFMLPTATTVTGLRVWGTYLGRGKADTDQFTVKFYERGVSPIAPWPSYPSVGKLIATLTPLSVKRTKTGRASFGALDSEYVYDLTFAGVPVAANTLYYVSIYNVTSSSDWIWMTSTVQGFPSWGAYSSDGGATWPGGSAELAFQLSNVPAVTPPPPPPTTITATYKLDVRRNGKGTVTVSPTGGASSGTAYAAGTVVTLTAIPDPADKSSVWKGWSGDVVSTNPTITVTMGRNVSVTANFR